MTLDEAAAELYALAPADFVTRRDVVVAQARADGDRSLGAQVAKLRKPTVGAWLANLLVHEQRAQIEDCLLYTSPSPRDRQKSRMPSSA